MRTPVNQYPKRKVLARDSFVSLLLTRVTVQWRVAAHIPLLYLVPVGKASSFLVASLLHARTSTVVCCGYCYYRNFPAAPAHMLTAAPATASASAAAARAGGTFALMKSFLPQKCNVSTTFVAINDLEAVRAAITDRTTVGVEDDGRCRALRQGTSLHSQAFLFPPG